jgi:hypothetical protein
MAELPNESFVTISSETMHSLNEALRNIAENEILTSKQKDFLSQLLLQAKKEKNWLAITVSEICRYRKSVGKAVTVNRIRGVLNTLAELSVVTKTPEETGRGGKPINNYLIAPLHCDLNLNRNIGPYQSNLEKGKLGHNRLLWKKIESKNLQILKDYDNCKLVSEALFAGVFDRVMRFSKHQSLTENRIVTAIKIKGVTIRLQASSQLSRQQELVALEDQRVIRILVNKVLAAIEHWTPPENWVGSRSPELEDCRLKLNERIRRLKAEGIPSNEHEWRVELSLEERKIWSSSRFQTAENRFFLDVVDLAKWMGYKSPASTSVRLIVNKALWRLHKTEFAIDIGSDRDQIEEALEVMELLGLDSLNCKFHFLPELYSQYVAEFQFADDQRRLAVDGEDTDSFINDFLRQTRIWQLSISEDLFDRLKDRSFRNIFSANKEILDETSGVGHSLYNFFSSILSVGSKNNPGYNQSLTVLRKTIWPSRNFDDFDNQVIKLIRSYMNEKVPGEFDESLGSNCVSAFGFTFTLYRKENGALWLNVF